MGKEDKHKKDWRSIRSYGKSATERLTKKKDRSKESKTVIWWKGVKAVYIKISCDQFYGREDLMTRHSTRDITKFQTW